MEEQGDAESNNFASDSAEIALSNSLVVGKICSFSSSANDLLNHRRINRQFHSEATRRFKEIQQNHIDLRLDANVHHFLTLMRTRIGSKDINSIPFSAYKFDMWNSFQTLKRFLAEAGPNVYKLKFWAGTEDGSAEHQYQYEVELKVIFFLCRSPNLVDFELFTSVPVHIPNSSINSGFLKFPRSFPRLKIINLYYLRVEPSRPPDAVPLLTILISRASRLEHIQNLRIQDTSSDEENQGMDAVRALAQHHTRHVPFIGFCRVVVRPRTLPILYELMKLNLRVGTLSAYLLDTNEVVPAEDLIRDFSSWLSSLSSNLHTLWFTAHIRRLFGTVTFPIPPLPELTELRFTLRWNLNSDSEKIFRVLLFPDSFPALRRISLDLTCGLNTIITFEGSPLPFVEEFEIYGCPYDLELNAWHRLLPNLTSLRYNDHGEVNSFQGKNLGYILNHFLHLTSLELDFQPNVGFDYWNMLTGGSPRPSSTDTLLHGVLYHETATRSSATRWFNFLRKSKVVKTQPGPSKLLVLRDVSINPVHGVYPVISSLANLRTLRTLKCRPGKRSNLDAILYMTRIGRLGPLEKLTLTALVQDFQITDTEKADYRNILTQVHSDVCLMSGIHYTSSVPTGHMSRLLDENIGEGDD